MALIIDDSPALRSLFTEVLSSGGFATYAAGSPGEAAAVLDGVGPVDLLVADLNLGGRYGGDFAVAAARDGRARKVLVVSGSLSPVPVLAGLGDAGAFLQKPVDIGTLLATARALTA